MATLGQQLKAARLTKGVSEQQAGIATKTLTKMIVAMEADDFSGMAAPTYAKGFIRLYAGYLGLNPDPLIAEYMNRHAPGTKPLIDEDSQLEQNRRKPSVFPGSLKWLDIPANLFSRLLKTQTSGTVKNPATGLKSYVAKDLRALAVGAAVLLVLIGLVISATNYFRRHAAEKTAQPPAEAPAPSLLDKPLPDLYLVEPGKIESSR